VAHNVGVMVRFTQSARRHRIGRAHALYVMDASEPTVLEEPDQPRRLVWLAADDRGLMLEIVAIETPDYLLVIHVMPYDLRRRK
jgi:hypothetical protein